MWHIKKFKEYFDDITNLLNDISTDIKQKQSILINRDKQSEKMKKKELINYQILN